MKSRVLILVLVLVALAVSACAQTGAAGPPGADSAASGCPTPTEGMHLLVNEEVGYCVLYPAGLTVREHVENQRVIEGRMTESGQVIGIIQVTDAGDRTLDDVVEERILWAERSAGPAAPTIERGTIALDGQEAVVLDKMPGQDINRQIIFIRDGQLYDLLFAPANEESGEVYQQMEALYTAVTTSFHFIQ